MEARDHAEVAPTAADRPEEVGVVLGVDTVGLAVGGDQVGRQQAVDGEAVLPGEEPDSAPEGDPTDPD